MIGRPDPAIPADALWLTGFDRSNLGPELAKHGARLVPDPHPRRTSSSVPTTSPWPARESSPRPSPAIGLHKDYHQPSDELSKIDFPHMVGAIASMIEPIRWLANTPWRPRGILAANHSWEQKKSGPSLGRFLFPPK